MVEVLVEHDYIAKEPDELNIKKGDIIKDVIKKTGGWWEGTLNDKRGMFPDNFVRLIDLDSVILRNKKDSTKVRQCRVVFSYAKAQIDELTLKEGDLIDVIGEEEEGWWRGILNGKEGVFPSNFVEEMPPNTCIRPSASVREDIIGKVVDDAPALPAKPVKQQCRVLYEYTAQNKDELTLKIGNIVSILKKDGQDVGWWKGELNGKIGVFPENFVEILPLSNDEPKSPIRGGESVVETNSPSRPSSVASQRKSLESKNISAKTDSIKSTPPVPGKKPLISLKKSPSGSGSGLFSKLKDKLVDAVDGATGSKPKSEQTKENQGHENNTAAPTNVFDQVERRPLLSDVRANRARAPGRRLPRSIYKEDDDDDSLLILNGTVDSHKSEDSVKSEANSASSENLDNSSSSELDLNENKPKLREWEKHKAPWLEEMKLNQAKRTSVSPVPDLPKTKLINEAKNEHQQEPAVTSTSKSIQNSPAEKEVHLSDMSKSMSEIKVSPIDPKNKFGRMSTTDSDKMPPTIKIKSHSTSPVYKNVIGTTNATPALPPMPPPKDLSYKSSQQQQHTKLPSRPHTIDHIIETTSNSTTSLNTASVTSSHNISELQTAHTSLSTLTTSYITTDVTIDDQRQTVIVVNTKQFQSLIDRLGKLEQKCERQGKQIEELKCQLQMEINTKMVLHEKVMHSS